jgi:hypothetical protein
MAFCQGKRALYGIHLIEVGSLVAREGLLGVLGVVDQDRRRVMSSINDGVKTSSREIASGVHTKREFTQSALHPQMGDAQLNAMPSVSPLWVGMGGVGESIGVS